MIESVVLTEMNNGGDDYALITKSDVNLTSVLIVNHKLGIAIIDPHLAAIGKLSLLAFYEADKPTDFMNMIGTCCRLVNPHSTFNKISGRAPMKMAGARDFVACVKREPIFDFATTAVKRAKERVKGPEPKPRPTMPKLL